jgi:hypothetical protein
MSSSGFETNGFFGVNKTDQGDCRIARDSGYASDLVLEAEDLTVNWHGKLSKSIDSLLIFCSEFAADPQRHMKRTLVGPAKDMAE